jgi:hypothetical protein
MPPSWQSPHLSLAMSTLLQAMSVSTRPLGRGSVSAISHYAAAAAAASGGGSDLGRTSVRHQATGSRSSFAGVSPSPEGWPLGVGGGESLGGAGTRNMSLGRTSGPLRGGGTPTGALGRYSASAHFLGVVSCLGLSCSYRTAGTC